MCRMPRATRSPPTRSCSRPSTSASASRTSRRASSCTSTTSTSWPSSSRAPGSTSTVGREQRLRARHRSIFVAPGVSHGFRMGEDLVVYNCFLRVEAAQFDLPWARRDAWLARLFGPPGIEPSSRSWCRSTRRAFDRVPRPSRGDPRAPGRRAERGVSTSATCCSPSTCSPASSSARNATTEPARRRPRRWSPRPSTCSSGTSRRHWTLDDLAGQLFVGSFHLVRQFKRWLGASADRLSEPAARRACGDAARDDRQPGRRDRRAGGLARPVPFLAPLPPADGRQPARVSRVEPEPRRSRRDDRRRGPGTRRGERHLAECASRASDRGSRRPAERASAG